MLIDDKGSLMESVHREEQREVGWQREAQPAALSSLPVWHSSGF